MATQLTIKKSIRKLSNEFRGRPVYCVVQVSNVFYNEKEGGKRWIAYDDGSLFTMVDMGCADGGTSIAMVGTVLKEVRRRAPSLNLTSIKQRLITYLSRSLQIY